MRNIQCANLLPHDFHAHKNLRAQTMIENRLAAGSFMGLARIFHRIATKNVTQLAAQNSRIGKLRSRVLRRDHRVFSLPHRKKPIRTLNHTDVKTRAGRYCSNLATSRKERSLNFGFPSEVGGNQNEITNAKRSGPFRGRNWRAHQYFRGRVFRYQLTMQATLGVKRCCKLGKTWPQVLCLQGSLPEETLSPHLRTKQRNKPHIQNMIHQEYSAIAINAASPTALSSAVKEACGTSVIVVAFDSIVTEFFAWRIAVDFAEMGRLQVAVSCRSHPRWR